MTEGSRGRLLGWGLTGIFTAFPIGASIAPKLLGSEVGSETLRSLGWPADRGGGAAGLRRGYRR